VDTQNEENIDSVKSVYSMIKVVPIICFIYGRVAGRNIMKREKERVKERARETD